MSQQPSPPEPWGTRLRWHRECERRETREEFAEALNGLAYDQGQNVGCGARLVARWENGEVLVPRPVYQRLLAALGAPLPVAMAPPWQQRSHARSVEGGECASEREDVQRRQLLGASLAAAAGLFGEPWQRLASVLDGGHGVDEVVTEQVHARTVQLFELEERNPARQVSAVAAGHLDTIALLLRAAGAGGLRDRLVVDAGATAALAGWLAFDERRAEVAERYYRVAERAATDTGDPQLIACVLAYRSYLAGAQGDPGRARELLRCGQEQLGRGRSPVMRAWLSAREAEESVVLGDRDSTLRALERAMTAHEFAADGATPIWAQFFTLSRLAGMAAAAYASLRESVVDVDVKELLAATSGEGTKVHAIAYGDVAYAYLARGDLERGAALAHRAVELLTPTESQVGHERLRSIGRALEQYGGTAAARELRERVAISSS